MFQDLSNISLMPLELKLQLSPLLMQHSSPIALQRNLDERMNSRESEWLFQPPLLSGVNAELVNVNLWQQFHQHQTEMIITKSGRRMFPSVQLSVSGLQKRETYYVLLEVALASNQRHKYCGYENENRNSNMGGWSLAGPADPQHNFDRRIYMHPDSPAIGDHWMDNPIHFNRLKLTNNVNDKSNNVILASMHKYVPKIWIIRCSNAASLNELFSNPAASFIFKETEFIAVTAYQNENITKLKIDHNPFAKGFRETGQSRFKRKYQQTDQHAQGGSSRETSDEVGSPSGSFSDSESTPASSGRGSVSSAENSTQESAKRLAVERNNADSNARSIVPDSPVSHVVNRLSNAGSPLNTENDHNEALLHRPWVDRPSHRQVVPLSPYNRPPSLYYHSLHYGNTLPYMCTDNIQNYMRFNDYAFSNYNHSMWNAVREHFNAFRYYPLFRCNE